MFLPQVIMISYFIFLKAPQNIVIALAGNKCDLADSRAVDFEDAKQYAEENGLLFVETSAKTAFNVNDLFLAIGEFSTYLFFYLKYDRTFI